MDSLSVKKYFSATRLGAFLVGLVFVIGVWSCTEEALIQPKTYGIVRGQVVLFDTKQGVAKVSVMRPVGLKRTDALATPCLVSNNSTCPRTMP